MKLRYSLIFLSILGAAHPSMLSALNLSEMYKQYMPSIRPFNSTFFWISTAGLTLPFMYYFYKKYIGINIKNVQSKIGKEENNNNDFDYLKTFAKTLTNHDVNKNIKIMLELTFAPRGKEYLSKEYLSNEERQQQLTQSLIGNNPKKMLRLLSDLDAHYALNMLSIAWNNAIDQINMGELHSLSMIISMHSCCKKYKQYIDSVKTTEPIKTLDNKIILDLLTDFILWKTTHPNEQLTRTFIDQFDAIIEEAIENNTIKPDTTITYKNESYSLLYIAFMMQNYNLINFLVAKNIRIENNISLLDNILTLMVMNDDVHLLKLLLKKAWNYDLDFDFKAFIDDYIDDEEYEFNQTMSILMAYSLGYRLNQDDNNKNLFEQLWQKNETESLQFLYDGALASNDQNLLELFESKKEDKYSPRSQFILSFSNYEIKRIKSSLKWKINALLNRISLKVDDFESIGKLGKLKYSIIDMFLTNFFTAMRTAEYKNNQISSLLGSNESSNLVSQLFNDMQRVFLGTWARYRVLAGKPLQSHNDETTQLSHRIENVKNQQINTFRKYGKSILNEDLARIIMQYHGFVTDPIF